MLKQNPKNTMFGYSVDSILNVANAAYIICLALTLVLSFAIWRLSITSNRIKDDESERYKKDADIKIADARQDAAKANERAATLENEAQQAKLQLERMRSAISWRHFSEHQLKVLQEKLQGQNIQVAVFWTAGDPEQAAFAREIAETLQSVGLSVVGLTPITHMGQQPSTGVNISGQAGEVALLTASLSDAGVTHITTTFRDGRVDISVGPRPAPNP